MKYRYDPKIDVRNYAAEAIDLVKGLKGNQLYEMYDIVTNKLKQSNSPTRDKELQAVKTTIELDPRSDYYKLRFIITGYQSEMAENGKPSDGYSKPAGKRT